RLLVEVDGPPGSSYAMQVQVTPKQEEFGISIPLAFIVLSVLYLLIGFELVHRTLAALIGATMAVAFLSIRMALPQRPSLERVVSWLDVETLCLLFGMMVLVGILCETGFFDYAAVLAYRLARGRVWPMISMLCLFAAVISAFLDNVTTILLMTPVTIKLCEVMSLDPKQVLIIMVLFSNIGGAATPVGDPPNVIIISNHMVKALGINFTSFTLHMLPGILLCAVGAFAFLRFYFRDPRTLRLDVTEAVEIEHEIDVWRKAVHSLSEYSRDESHVRDVMSKKVRKLVRQQSKKSHHVRSTDFRENLRTLSEKYKIRNWSLLIKSGLVLLVVILLFFMQSIPNVHLSLGWIAILGAVTLMILADLSELEGVIARVEWTTLIFFGALFRSGPQALSELKLLLYVGHVTESWIRGVSQESRLVVSILIVTWVSSVVSSFVDNIPFTTVMIKIVTGLGESDLGLRLVPLVYALAFGSCLGGNGTLIGASANVVCAGVAEQHGYKFSFVQFLRIGFPVMLLTTAISTGWLLLCHVVIQWDS
ncbi:pink-eyed dilution protein, putative, partial [Ixodes scapularis]